MKQARTDNSASVSLAVPCRPEYVSLCRLVVGSLGLREGLEEEDVADLKVAVSEAFTCFLGGADEYAGTRPAVIPEDARVRIDFEVDPGEWTILVSNPDQLLGTNGQCRARLEAEDNLGITILRALLDSVEVENDSAQGTELRLVKRMSSPSDTEE